MIPRRVPSGRRATEQPNATGDETPLSLTFWLLIVLTGVAAGLLGDLMMLVLGWVQHFAFGYKHGTFGDAVGHASPSRRLIALAVGGALTGLAWYVLRRRTAGLNSDLDDELWSGTGRLSFRRSLGTSLISEVAVGVGASLGKEAAPKLMGGAAASAFARWMRLTAAQRRLLVACGGGAGMGAVYNVPVGGALITAELLYGTIALPVVLPALACSCIATVTSWIALPTHATYTNIPAYSMHATYVVFAVVLGPVIGLVSVVYVRFIGWVSHHQVRGRLVLVGPLIAFVLVGLVSWGLPELLGNGADLVHSVLVSGGTASLAVLAALLVLKPLLTGLCLSSGATGGLFTPTLCTGALLGGVIGQMWSEAWPGAAVGGYAVIAAAAMLGAAMQAPLAALVLVTELTATTTSLVLPMAAATALATIVARYLDGYSIYTSRLSARPINSAPV